MEDKNKEVMVKPVIETSPDHIFQHMIQSNYREHNMLVYPRLDVLRDIYSRYCKSQLEKGKEIVTILPMYENISSVRRTLRGYVYIKSVDNLSGDTRFFLTQKPH